MASAASVPKFYKSVIDDVIQSMREIFLDDGIDEQVIQEFKQTWERKVLDSRAVEHALQQQQVSTTTSSSNPNAQTVTSTNSNASSSSSKSEKSAGKASTLSSSTTNSAGQQQSQPVHTTSVITSNPNHQTSNQTKNSKNSTNNSKNLTEPNKTKSEMTKNPVMGNHHSKTISNAPSIAIHATNSNIVQNAMTQNIMLTNPQQQIRPSTTTLTSIHSQPEQLFRTSAIVPNNSISLAAAPGTNATVLQEVKFAPSMIQGGPKVVLLPNNLMASNATPGQLVIHPEFLNLPHNSVIAGGQQVFPAAGIQYIQGPPGSAGQTSVLAAPLHQVRPIAANLTAVQQTSQPNGPVSRVAQLDGHHDSNDSSDEEDEDDEFNDNDDDIEDNDDEINDEENETGVEEEPLNSEDDVSDEDPVELFETDNVVVCQYDKITRSRNKWKFHFKDGIMNLQGKDYVFSRAVGDAEW
ncbi:Transcription initiation factor IIA subunit 1 [Sarcoptes scabiei]|nr:Transcription initiation factor IIA subunit 1 [Sarcoptes scabiei]